MAGCFSDSTLHITKYQDANIYTRDDSMNIQIRDNGNFFNLIFRKKIV